MLETIKVKNDKSKDGWMIINKSDFDGGDYEIWKEEKPKAKKAVKKAK